MYGLIDLSRRLRPAILLIKKTLPIAGGTLSTFQAACLIPMQESINQCT
jgi:hypothetical protein